MSAIFAEAASQWSRMKLDYDEAVEAQIGQAEVATNGAMLNRAGRARGISAESLFTGSAARAEKYASEELRAFWSVHPRIRLSDFESQWVGLVAS